MEINKLNKYFYSLKVGRDSKASGGEERRVCGERGERSDLRCASLECCFLC